MDFGIGGLLVSVQKKSGTHEIKWKYRTGILRIMRKMFYADLLIRINPRIQLSNNP